MKNFHQSAPPFEAAKLIKKERPSNRAFIVDASPRHREPGTGRAPLGPRRGAIENFFPLINAIENKLKEFTKNPK